MIVPSVFAAVMGATGRKRLPVAWAFGIIMSLVGMILSYFADLPTGATVVVVFGLGLFLATFIPALLHGRGITGESSEITKERARGR